MKKRLRDWWFYLLMALSLTGQFALGIYANIWDGETIDYATAWWTTGNLAVLLAWFVVHTHRRRREEEESRG